MPHLIWLFFSLFSVRTLIFLCLFVSSIVVQIVLLAMFFSHLMGHLSIHFNILVSADLKEILSLLFGYIENDSIAVYSWLLVFFGTVVVKAVSIVCFRINVLFDLRAEILKKSNKSQIDVSHLLGGEAQRATKCIEHFALGVGNSAILGILVIATLLYNPIVTLFCGLVFSFFILVGKKVRALLIERSVALSGKVEALGVCLVDRVSMEVEACQKVNCEIFNANVQLNESDARSERLLELSLIGLISVSCLYFSMVTDMRTVLLVLLFGFIGKVGLDFLRGVGSCFRKVNNAYGGLDSVGRIISEERNGRSSNK